MRVRFFKYKYYNRKSCLNYAEERGHTFSTWEKFWLMLNPRGKVEIPFLDLDVNTLCNLRCQRCAKNIPYYHHAAYFPAEEVIASLEKLLTFVDKVYAVSIIGGEPFLNKDIAKIIRYCSDCRKIADVDITTNATVFPAEDVFDALQNSRVVVHVSDYQLGIPALEEKKRRFLAELEARDIPYQYFTHESWLDFGPIEHHEYSAYDKKLMFYQCPMHSCTVFNRGVLYRCGKSSYLHTQEGICPESERIDVNAVADKREMKKRLKTFFCRSTLKACEYCQNHPQSIQPGIQIERRTGHDHKGS